VLAAEGEEGGFAGAEGLARGVVAVVEDHCGAGVGAVAEDGGVEKVVFYTVS